MLKYYPLNSKFLFTSVVNYNDVFISLKKVKEPERCQEEECDL